ncbi:MAG: glycoside hydrolase family 15 protein [Acuticoccus sp.]
MAYRPIDSYAIIGDMRSAALVNLDGAIDWFCMPRFDSPSVFAAILDDDKGGSFCVAPHDLAEAKRKQYYWPGTNVLVTRFLLEKAVVEVIDFMPVGPQTDDSCRVIVRRVQAVRGKPRMCMTCRPAFNYARDPHTATHVDGAIVFKSPTHSLSLRSGGVPMTIEDGMARADFTMEQGEEITFLLSGPSDPDADEPLLETDAEEAFRTTVDYWRGWLSQCTYRGRWREIVERSALALKLMTYDPTGAIVAAPTCSLPEGIGGERNWDYRYTWLRDSAFTIFALVRLGFRDEATRFAEFLHSLARSADDERPLQIMYGIDGRRTLTEETLDHLDGYCGSRPVRIGNGAYDQLQLDIYGELLDALSLFNRDVRPVGFDMWQSITKLADYVCDNWVLPDEGVWETRGGRQHFLYSKHMCWVALDRTLRIGEDRALPTNPRWREVRDVIYEEVMTKGWDPEKEIFVQHYGSKTLDASNLTMVITSFLSPAEQRAKKLLKAVMRPPEEGGLLSNSLVYRYNVEETQDGLDGEEGTFNLCTFWLVNALARAGRYDDDLLEEARLIFERMLGFANHVGLYAEETGPSGEGLGNFPQAFTHLGLITAAINLDRALEERH